MARGENQNRNKEPKKIGHSRQHRSRQSADPQYSGSNPDQDGRHYPGEDLKPLGTNEKNFSIVVDSVPYVIKAIPFSFNGEIRYRVSYNGSPAHVFTWDSSLSQLRAIDDDSATMPDNLEIAISEKLQS